MLLEDFNQRYTYVSDSEQYGVGDLWEVIEPNTEGMYAGDCESYIATLIAKVAGMKGLEPWYCKYISPDGSAVAHCIGRDPSTGLYIDCNYQKFVTFEQLSKEQGWQTYRKFGKFEWYKGLLYAKAFKKLNRKVAIGLTNWLR